MAIYSIVLYVLLLHLSRTIHAVRGISEQCCNLAKNQLAWIPDPSINSNTYTCGQSYSRSNIQAPAPDLRVNLTWCKTNCGGQVLSTTSKTNAWALSLLHLILPAVILSMAVPRCSAFKSFRRRHAIVWICVVVADRLILFVEATFWVFGILTASAPLMISGLFEAMFDFRVTASATAIRSASGLTRRQRVEVLTAVLTGNFGIQTPPSDQQTQLGNVLRPNVDDQAIGTSLTSMLMSQDFPGCVLSTCSLLYLGTFFYVLPSLSTSTDVPATSIAIAIGIWWMTMVLGSVISEMLPTTNNQSAATIGLDEMNLTRRQHYMEIIENTRSKDGTQASIEDFSILSLVSASNLEPTGIWTWGSGKGTWLRQILAWQDTTRQSDRKIHDVVEISKRDWLLITVEAYLLVLLPCTLVLVVEYLTPSIGNGCRFRVVFFYIATQIVSVTLSSLSISVTVKGLKIWESSRVRSIGLTAINILYSMTWLSGLIVTVWSTWMQSTGRFQTCACTALHTWSPQPIQTVSLASDTEQDRKAAHFSTIAGYFAAFLLCVLVCISWLLQLDSRQYYELDVARRLGNTLSFNIYGNTENKSPKNGSEEGPTLDDSVLQTTGNDTDSLKSSFGKTSKESLNFSIPAARSGSPVTESVKSSALYFKESRLLADMTANDFMLDLLQNQEILTILAHVRRDDGISVARFVEVFRLLFTSYSLNLEKASQNGDEMAAVALVQGCSESIALIMQNMLTDREKIQSQDLPLHPRHNESRQSQRPLSEAHSDSIVARDDRATEATNEHTGFDYLSIKSFLFGKGAFVEFRANLWNLADPSLKMRLSGIISEISDSNLLNLSLQENMNWMSHLQRATEDFTGVGWDWWPMRQCRAKIAPGFERLRWQCACGDERFEDVPQYFAEKILKTPRADMKSMGISAEKPQSDRLTHTILHPEVYDNSSSQKEGGTSNSPQQIQGSTLPAGLSPVTEACRTDPTRLDINLHILLGVPLGDDLRVEHIDVLSFEDDQFFKQLRKAYCKVKGVLRFYFGIRKYAHCDFYKFEKFDAEEFVALDRNSVPAPHNAHYQYNPKPIERMPPISRHEFKKRFYWCYGRCLPGLIGLPSPFHRCKKRCRTCPDAVNLVPKRNSPLETGGDAREEFWGLYVGEVISAMTVVVYLVLLLMAPFVFWFLWLFCWGHPGDLQNASVPLICTLGLIGLSSCGLFGGSLYSERAV